MVLVGRRGPQRALLDLLQLLEILQLEVLDVQGHELLLGKHLLFDFFDVEGVSALLHVLLQLGYLGLVFILFLHLHRQQLLVLGDLLECLLLDLLLPGLALSVVVRFEQLRFVCISVLVVLGADQSAPVLVRP